MQGECEPYKESLVSSGNIIYSEIIVNVTGPVAPTPCGSRLCSASSAFVWGGGGSPLTHNVIVCTRCTYTYSLKNTLFFNKILFVQKNKSMSRFNIRVRCFFVFVAPKQLLNSRLTHTTFSPT